MEVMVMKTVSSPNRNAMVHRMTLQGKWSAIRRLVESLVTDGWTEMLRSGEPDFQFTTVELMREL